MSYTALYRAWRPLNFDDVIGQNHVTSTLKNEIKLGRIGHAYLFCGSRGTGKTSTARILSRAVNCQNPKDGNPCNECENCKGILDGTILDISEIDAASNNGVDNIRDLREEARFTSTRLKKRIYIVDEVHMLTTSAFNALLKILEEPPAHVVFILATTEAHKVPDTILSRCQRFDFKRIDSSDIEKQLAKIISASSYSVEDSGINLIAEKADGSMRDALSLLDQCMAIGGTMLSYDDISSFLGMTDSVFLKNMFIAIYEKNIGKTLKSLSEYVSSGKNIPQLIEDFISYARNLLMCKYISDPSKSLGVSPETVDEMKIIAEHYTAENLLYIISLAVQASNQVRFSKNARVIFELELIKMINPIYADSTESLAARLSEIESKISGNFIPPVPKKQVTENKRDTSAEKKESARKDSVEKPVSSEIVKKLEASRADIVSDLFSHNQLKASFAFETAIFEEENGKLGILFESDDELTAFKKLLDDNSMELLKNTISKHSHISPDLYFGVKQNYKASANDKLIKLSQKLDS